MNLEEAKIFAAQLRKDLPALDLHGLYPGQALQKLELFLFEQNNLHQEVLKIIYGAGTGKLKNTVLEYLHKHPLVDTISETGGSCLVFLNKTI